MITRFNTERAEIHAGITACKQLNISTSKPGGIELAYGEWLQRVERLEQVEKALPRTLTLENGVRVTNSITMERRAEALRQDAEHMIRWVGSLLATYIDTGECLVPNRSLISDEEAAYVASQVGHGTSTEIAKEMVAETRDKTLPWADECDLCHARGLKLYASYTNPGHGQAKRYWLCRDCRTVGMAELVAK